MTKAALQLQGEEWGSMFSGVKGLRLGFPGLEFSEANPKPSSEL